MKHVTLSVMAMATSLVLGSSADARPGHGVAARRSAGSFAQRSHTIHRGTAPRFNHRIGVQRTGFHQPGIRRPGTRRPGTHRPGTHRPGTHRPGTHRPGTHRPGTHRPGTHRPGTHRPGSHRPGTHRPHWPGSRRVARGHLRIPRRHVIVKHRRFVRTAGYLKRFGNRYHLRFGKRFRFGWYYPGFWHRHWSRCVWIPRYRAYCYWDAGTTQYYYWCQPRNCYYPVTYCPTGRYDYEYSGPAAPVANTECETCPAPAPTPECETCQAPAPSTECETCQAPQPVPAVAESNSDCDTCQAPQPVPAVAESNSDCDTCRVP
jgi:hypothetical protein